MNIFFYIIIFMFLVFSIFFSFIYFSFEYLKIRNNERTGFINNFENYMILFNYHMDKAYEIIYKERIMVFSIEGMKLTENEFQVVARDFATLVLRMIGPNVKSSLISLYGNEETLLFNIFEYFSNKFENDEVYRSSVDNMMTKDQLSLGDFKFT